MKDNAAEFVGSGRERVVLVDRDELYYVEAAGDDTLLRTARRKFHRHIEPLEDVTRRLPSPPFLRVHRSYLANLSRVWELRPRSKRDYELKLEPPVNKVLPIGRYYYPELVRVLGL